MVTNKPPNKNQVFTQKYKQKSVIKPILNKQIPRQQPNRAPKWQHYKQIKPPSTPIPVQCKFYTSFTTSLDHVASFEFLKQLNNFAPFMSASAAVRLGMYIVMAIGIDTLVELGAFSQNAEEVIINIANKIKELRK